MDRLQSPLYRLKPVTVLAEGSIGSTPLPHQNPARFTDYRWSMTILIDYKIFKKTCEKYFDLQKNVPTAFDDAKGHQDHQPADG
jgi:hypothetical protein